MKVPSVRRNARSPELEEAVQYAEMAEQQALYSFHNDPQLSNSFGNIVLAYYAYGRVVEASRREPGAYKFDPTRLHALQDAFRIALNQLERKKAGSKR